jgi:hypothetical protein
MRPSFVTSIFCKLAGIQLGSAERAPIPRRKCVTKCLLRAAIGAGIAASSMLVVGCGGISDSGVTAEKSISSQGTADPTPYARRFDAKQIAATYTNEARNGVPVNRPPLYEYFTQATQAPDLAREFGDFNSASVVRSYLNLNQDPMYLPPTRFVIALESVSSWTKIKDATGAQIFKEAYSIDAAGNRIPDQVDGELPGGEQTQYGRFKLPVSIATLTADMEIRIKDRGNYLSAELRNIREIRAPFVGTVVKPGGFRIFLELFPYNKGFLTYAVAAAKLEQFADKMSPEQLSAQVTSILNWLRSQLEGKSSPLDLASR